MSNFYCETGGNASRAPIGDRTGQQHFCHEGEVDPSTLKWMFHFFGGFSPT
jgi:hypothetical protein